MKLHVKRLGMAGYLKMKGYKFLGCENREFIFEDGGEGITIEELEIEYVNSCCNMHDREIMELRGFLK